MAGLPPTWAIIVAIVSLLFGGTTGIVWSLRRERREAKLAPAEAEKRRLDNERTAAEIAQMLRDAQKEAISEMKGLLAQARDEAHAAREESSALRLELAQVKAQHREMQDSQAAFRLKVEDLLTAHGIAIPDWWHN